jgi:hypothetical protein
MVMARMLAEVAASDGNLEEEERSFFGYFITPDMGTLESIVQAAPLSPAELGECSQGPVRETMLMLTWALALSDGEIEAGEVGRLTTLAAGLVIPESRAVELRGYAMAYQVDAKLGAVYASGQRDQVVFEQIAAQAQQMGMSRDAIERVDIRYRKRFGLV